MPVHFKEVRWVRTSRGRRCSSTRDQVVAMWREMGLTCLQVAYGNF